MVMSSITNHPTPMEEWRDVALGDLIEIEHGYAFKGAGIHDEAQGDILLTPGNFANGGGFKADRFKYYDGSVPDDFVLKEGDLLVTMTDLSKQSDTLGYPAFVPTSPIGHRYLHNQRLGKIRPKKDASIYIRFIYYVMCSSAYREEVLASATGTTVKHTAPSRIKQFHFKLPPLAEQHAIAEILGALDDKIELNRRMNETLEQMARTLYKSWFVDFDPVRAKMDGRWERGESLPGMPAELYDLFPDDLVPSELGEIPGGWSVRPLNDIVTVRGRAVSPKEVDPETPYVGLDHIPRRSLALAEWSRAREVSSNKAVFERGDVLFGKLRPYFHKVAIAPVAGIASTDALVIRPVDDAWSTMMVCILSSEDFVAYTDRTSTGTKMPRTSWPTMGQYKVCLPPASVAFAFRKMSGGLLEGIVSRVIESRHLASQRDALLPKLISGDMRVTGDNTP